MLISFFSIQVAPLTYSYSMEKISELLYPENDSSRNEHWSKWNEAETLYFSLCEINWGK